jgi:RNA polymerase sigma factor (sigma-70 family)
MTETQTLLAQFARDGSESAFRELVSRYINLVYSTALRLTGNDTHLAEDVTQVVFADLARKARSLPEDVMLGGWLHQHTRFVAGKVMRTERRRLNRERQAAAMSAQEDHSEANLAQLAPVLDEAISQLSFPDRTAILLRYFELKDHRTIGEMLGTSEEAARKRVDRALDQLELLLRRRGLALSAVALGSLLVAHSVTAAPAGLAASIADAAWAGAGTGGAFSLLAATKTKLAIASVILLAAGSSIVLVQRKSSTKDSPVASHTTPAVEISASKTAPALAGNTYPATAQKERTPGVPLQPGASPSRSTNDLVESGVAQDSLPATNYLRAEIGVLPGFNSIHVNALNNRGQMVGSIDSTNHQTHAFFWENGVLTDLGTLGGSKSLATAINDAGDVVGIILTNGERHAFLRHQGKVSDLGMIDRFAKLGEEGDLYRGGPGTIYYAPRVSINGLSAVTGTVTDQRDNPHSFVLNKGQTSYFGQLSDGNVFYSESINNRGQIIGRATQHGGPMRAMFWQNGELKDLAAFLGAQSASASINDRGIMMGWLVPTNGAPEQGYAFVWEDGRLRRLNCGEDNAHPSAMNNRGHIVGYAQKSGRRFACLWRGDRILDLNDLLDGKSEWQLSSADAINDRGQILAWETKGKQHRHCLLSPANPLPLLEDPLPAVAAAPTWNQAAAIAPFNLTLFERLPNGAFRLTFAGAPEGEYYVEASTNLVAWDRLGPAVNSQGKVEFTDTNAAKFSLRFYRAVRAAN